MHHSGVNAPREGGGVGASLLEIEQRGPRASVLFIPLVGQRRASSLGCGAKLALSYPSPPLRGGGIEKSELARLGPIASRERDQPPNKPNARKTPVPTISCINISLVPQVLGRRPPIWYPANATSIATHDRPQCP